MLVASEEARRRPNTRRPRETAARNANETLTLKTFKYTLFIYKNNTYSGLPLHFFLLPLSGLRPLYLLQSVFGLRRSVNVLQFQVECHVLPQTDSQRKKQEKCIRGFYLTHAHTFSSVYARLNNHITL